MKFGLITAVSAVACIATAVSADVPPEGHEHFIDEQQQLRVLQVSTSASSFGGGFQFSSRDPNRDTDINRGANGDFDLMDRQPGRDTDVTSTGTQGNGGGQVSVNDSENGQISVNIPEYQPGIGYTYRPTPSPTNEMDFGGGLFSGFGGLFGGGNPPRQRQSPQKRNRNNSPPAAKTRRPDKKKKKNVRKRPKPPKKRPARKNRPNRPQQWNKRPKKKKKKRPALRRKTNIKNCRAAHRFKRWIIRRERAPPRTRCGSSFRNCKIGKVRCPFNNGNKAPMTCTCSKTGAALKCVRNSLCFRRRRRRKSKKRPRGRKKTKETKKRPRRRNKKEKTKKRPRRRNKKKPKKRPRRRNNKKSKKTRRRRNNKKKHRLLRGD